MPGRLAPGCGLEAARGERRGVSPAFSISLPFSAIILALVSTIGDRLQAARSHLIAGRDDEVERFQAALTDEALLLHVLHVSGPVG
jgi:hypothetical protein